MDSKIEEATRPVAAQRTQAAQQHSALQEEVEELRSVPCECPLYGFSHPACDTDFTMKAMEAATAGAPISTDVT